MLNQKGVASQATAPTAIATGTSASAIARAGSRPRRRATIRGAIQTRASAASSRAASAKGPRVMLGLRSGGNPKSASPNRSSSASRPRIAQALDPCQRRSTRSM